MANQVNSRVMALLRRWLDHLGQQASTVLRHPCGSPELMMTMNDDGGGGDDNDDNCDADGDDDDGDDEDAGYNDVMATMTTPAAGAVENLQHQNTCFMLLNS